FMPSSHQSPLYLYSICCTSPLTCRTPLYYHFFFFLMLRRPPRSTLFPYTTLSDLFCRVLCAAERRKIASVDFFMLQFIREKFCLDRKSTRLNSSHVSISYAVFCLKKKQRGLAVGPHRNLDQRR